MWNHQLHEISAAIISVLIENSDSTVYQNNNRQFSSKWNQTFQFNLVYVITSLNFFLITRNTYLPDHITIYSKY